MIVGGMPAAVESYLKTKNLTTVANEQQSIIELFPNMIKIKNNGVPTLHNGKRINSHYTSVGGFHASHPPRQVKCGSTSDKCPITISYRSSNFRFISNGSSTFEYANGSSKSNLS